MKRTAKGGGHRELARELGVSPTTVSLVLSGRAEHYRISAATQRRIRARAAARGWTPARNRRRRRTLLVGLPEKLHAVDRPGFVSEVLDPLTHALAAEGWRITMAPFTTDAPLGITPALLREATAVLLPTTGDTERLVERIARQALRHGIWPVILGRTYPGLDGIMVDGDQEAGGRAAAAHLLDLGHRDIAVLPGRRGDRHSAERLRGFSGECARRGCPLPGDRVWAAGDYWVIGAHEATFRRLGRGRRPTAIFYLCDAMAIGGFYAIRERGLRVPEDVSVIGYDDDRDAIRGLRPALTTIRVQVGDAGGRVARALVERAAGRGEAAPLTIRCPVRLVRRASTAMPRTHGGEA